MAPELTSIFAVADSVVFVCGLAIGAAGRHGVTFAAHVIETFRPGRRGRADQQQQQQPRDEDGRFK